MNAEQVAESLSDARLPCGTEAKLQEAIAAHLCSLGVVFNREHWLAESDRVDFLLPNGLAVEVKIRGSANEVMHQLMRYAQHETVRELLLVTSKLTLASVPSELNGKPVRVAIIWGCL